MTGARPRSADDLDALYLRARLRLERRRFAGGEYRLPGYPTDADYIRHDQMLVREAAALVAAIDALREDEPIPLDVPPHYDGRDGSLEISQDEEDAMIAGEDENQLRWAHGDR